MRKTPVDWGLWWKIVNTVLPCVLTAGGYFWLGDLFFVYTLIALLALWVLLHPVVTLLASLIGTGN
ncbi:MAG: hypothetical protein LBR88_02155 [Zoogloeaceae bacterium]|jgi:hypothetical protein|nr:hypothetical protein [Zoogloeaceae bacterium]